MNRQLISPEKVAVVSLTAGTYQVRLALRLTDEFTGGNLVRLAPGATVSVEGADDLSSSYTRANWVSGIASGALYAFRTLRVPRQCVVVTEFTGRLRSCDMDTVANASAIAVARLVDRELSGVSAEGWDVQAQVTDGAGPEGFLSTQRGLELRSMSTAELFQLISADRGERGLSAGDIRLIHDIAAERMKAGDAQANEVLAAAEAYTSSTKPMGTSV
jgi:hypothetical protein